MARIQEYIEEQQREAETTRRVLQRVPEDKLAWRPHEKSMTLGQLALHIARIPGGVAEIVVKQRHEANFVGIPQPASKAEILSTLEQSLAKCSELLGGLDDAALDANWELYAGGRAVMVMPRKAVVRSILLNHWYHHRGQLTVYLREVGAMVPSVYGPSADEQPDFLN